MGNWIMKSKEFLIEHGYDVPSTTFGVLGKEQIHVPMAEYTDAMKIMLDFHSVYPENPGFDSRVRVVSKSEPHLKTANTAFKKFFDGVSPINSIGQSYYGFDFDVSDLTPEIYAGELERTLQQWNFTKQ